MSIRALSATAIALSMALSSTAGQADTADADCVLRKDGEKKEGASGACTFSQRQGYINIDLRNGDRFELTPGDKPDHYRDQVGKKVVRTVAGDGSHEYKWEGKKITVTFRSGSGHGSQGGGDVAETPQDLRDLPGSKYVGGEVDDEMVRRGYRHVRDEQSGGQIWSYWRSGHGGHCVVVHMGEKRHVKSVANAQESSCK